MITAYLSVLAFHAGHPVITQRIRHDEIKSET